MQHTAGLFDFQPQSGHRSSWSVSAVVTRLSDALLLLSVLLSFLVLSVYIKRREKGQVLVSQTVTSKHVLDCSPVQSVITAALQSHAKMVTQHGVTHEYW